MIDDSDYLPHLGLSIMLLWMAEFEHEELYYFSPIDSHTNITDGLWFDKRWRVA